MSPVGVSAFAHDQGPGQIITCVSGILDSHLGVGVTVTNTANGQSKSISLGALDGPGEACATILNAASQVGVRAEMEAGNAVALYGNSNSVSVGGATISAQKF